VTSKTSNCSATPPLKTPLKALSFFSGSMGLELGLEQEGIEILLACESDPAARSTIEFNRPDIALIEDIRRYSAAEILERAGLSSSEEIDLILGSLPVCTFDYWHRDRWRVEQCDPLLGFSYGNRDRWRVEQCDPLLRLVDIIAELKPKFAVIESIAQLLYASLPDIPDSIDKITHPTLSQYTQIGNIFSFIIHKLSEVGYGVSFNLYNTADFGSSQQMERVIIICNRGGEELPYLTPTHTNNNLNELPRWKTLRDSIGEISSDRHTFRKLPKGEAKYYLSLKPGEFWQRTDQQQEEIVEAGKFALTNKIRVEFYLRFVWDEPLPALVSWYKFSAHPEADRYLSVEECKLIQELPDDWEIKGNLTSQYRQVARATPSSLGRAIGKMLLAYLEQENSISYGQKIKYIFDRISTPEEWRKEVNSYNSLGLKYEKYWQFATHKYFLLYGKDTEIEVICTTKERADLLVRSMNMIIEFKPEFNKRNLRDGVDQLNGYAEDPKIDVKRKVLIGLPPKSESKKIAIIEEIQKLKNENINLEIHMHDPEIGNFNLYQILNLDREECSELEKKIIETKQNFFEWLFIFFTKTIPYYLNEADDCFTGAVYAVGDLLNSSSQIQSNSIQ
jgi:DNA (cytosine-5)-methyltransferase 1